MRINNVTSRYNSKGVLLEVGKTYFYYNKGLGEVREHTINSFEASMYSLSSRGKVEQDSLHYKREDVFNKVSNYE